VGVVDADLSLLFPDFRAAERTFQVLTQVAGRAGREGLPGLVLVQTRNPFHPVLTAVLAGDYDRFIEAELKMRREAGFPPFRRLALLRVSSPSEPEGRRAAQAAAALARRLGGGAGIEVVGPAPAPLEKIKGRHRFQVLLKAPGPEPGPLQSVLRRLLGQIQPGRNVRLHADVDPVSML
jgi:primosomal protein N' (replication factor Y)